MSRTIGQFIQQAAARLAPVSPTPRLDAEVLAMRVCGLNRTALVARGDTPLGAEQQRALDAALARRAAGEPVAYITGEREFWSMTLRVTPDTLIPRPETELLVEQALARLPGNARATIADLGTGSGAIALAIARERPACRVIATDRSAAALAVARANAARLRIDNVEFREGKWLAPLAGLRLDMIVSNPPYVRDDDPHLAEGDVRFEPAAALAGGAAGLDAIREITAAARDRLADGGRLLLEHGPDQGPALRALLAAFGYREITSVRDLAGHERVTLAQSKNHIFALRG
jgi:release factor glutamine methyltransferase